MVPKPSLQLDRHSGRVRLALVLLLLTLLALTGRFIEDSLVKQVQKDCGSLFADRLVPATLLVRMTDELHTRYHALQQSVAGDGKPGDDLRFRLSESDAQFKDLVDQFEQTYLVQAEATHLRKFQASLDNYRAQEQTLLGAPSQGMKYLHQSFAHARNELKALTAVQLDVGTQLNEGSLRDTSSISTLSYLQGAIAFIFGLIASALAMGLGTTRRKASQTDPRLH